jgi:hypothetical protein
MGPIAYSLCQKPVVGLLMYITSACAFPPLLANQPLPLTQAVAATSAAFTVEVDQGYSLDMAFRFPDADAAGRDEIVGSRYDQYCEPGVKMDGIPAAQLAGLGRPIPFRVTVRRQSDKALVLERRFTSLCKISSTMDGMQKTRQIGRLDLTRGAYLIEVTNLESQPGLDGVTTSFSLVAGHGK